jgi:hypothetical protein
MKAIAIDPGLGAFLPVFEEAISGTFFARKIVGGRSCCGMPTR